MISQYAIDEFWHWFLKVSGEFGDGFENQQLIEELDRRIALLGQYSWEIGSGLEHDLNSSLTFSPSGNQDLLVETREIVKAAPACLGWEFYSAKPPKKWQRQFILKDEDDCKIPVDASHVRYVLFKYPDGMCDIILEDRMLIELPENLQQTAVEILLDGELGEEKRMTLISSIEVVSELDNAMQTKSTSIEYLARHINSLDKGQG